MPTFFKKIAVAASIYLAATSFLAGQNPLMIPPLLTGDTIDLELRAGTQIFYPPAATPTYGVNGTWMAPTIAVDRGDTVTLRVTNHLNATTTIHWHGLHVAPQHDGGPHQPIFNNATWSPRFEVKNRAATYWYHPHGAGKTDLHVSRGIAGFLIVRDSVEAVLPLPRTYGVDDFPIVVQTKAFDPLQQIAIATNGDTALFVNGTLDPYLDAPAQVIRLRLLDGSSMRSYNFGFAGDLPFALIATDGGLRDSAWMTTRIRLSPGERAEILLDLSGLQGQTVTLRNFGSELPDGIYGAAQVGNSLASILDYALNPRNGADYDILPIHIGAATANPITTMPIALTTYTAMDTLALDERRALHLSPMVPSDSSTFAEGPFGINGRQFEMDSINITTSLGHKEVWHLVNTTLVAHPFHLHDVQFDVVAVNGGPVPPFLRGSKDVILVMPGESVDIVTRFEDFADAHIPYMYHCHLLHHEDEGMMGSFLVLDTIGVAVPRPLGQGLLLRAFPNPSRSNFTLQFESEQKVTSATVVNAWGQVVQRPNIVGRRGKLSVDIHSENWEAGIYSVRIVSGAQFGTIRLVKE